MAAGAFVWAERGSPYPDDWDPRVADLAAFVERERGLDFDHPVTVEFLTPDEYATRTRTAETDITAQDREAITEQTAVLRALGLASGDVDLLEASNDMADTGTLAFYDPSIKQVVVRGTEVDVNLEVTLVHELTHVLQDQHFDLDGAMSDMAAEDDGDAAARFEAYRALIEGDAVRIELAYVDQLPAEQIEDYFSAYDEELSRAEESLADVPAAMIAFQTAPYALGHSLVDVIAAAGANAAVDEAFADPPTTDEHMLDPRSYLARDTATPLDDPALPAGVEATTDDGPMGAVEIYLVLADRLDPLLALDAADGWGNGRYIAYDDDNRTCVRMTFDGDTDLDDQQLREAFDGWAAAMPPESAASVTDVGGGHTLVESCDPGAEVDGTNDRALDMLTIPAVRVQITSVSAAAGIDAAEAWATGDCFVRQLTPEQLVEANESSSPTPELQEAITTALASCSR